MVISKGLIIGIISSVIILSLIGLFIYYKIKSKKGFPFLLYSRDGKSISIINAKIRSDPENVTRKVFVFQELDTLLPIRPPTISINGVNYREITYNELSEFNYLKATGITLNKKDLLNLTNEEISEIYKSDKNVKAGIYLKNIIFDSAYREVALTPEEKQITLMRMKENNRRYAEPVNKTQLMMIGMMLLMVLIVGIGIIYSTVAFVKTSSNQIELAKENNKLSENTKQQIDSINRISEQQVQITALLTGNDGEIIRNLS